MAYKKVDTSLNFVDREKEVLDFWKENNVFEQSIENRKDSESFTFFDGPPTANGKPHVGHVLTRAIKDLIPRYKTMKGYKVLRKAGWDTHGLPVELEIEKKLGLDGKEQIEEYGIEPFIKKCKESVWEYKDLWEQFSDKVGYWIDTEDPYITYDNNFIESEWWSLKKIFDKGLLYKGHKIVPYCSRCGTPLSSHEVAQGYKDVKEESVYVRFKVKGTENDYILAWTTTPWTLPSNVALCMHPEYEYVKVKNNKDGLVYYMAQALVASVLGEDVEVLASYKGKDLEYKEYVPLFPYASPLAEKQHKKAFFVTCDEYVTLTDGTGVVHIAPGCGSEDFDLGLRHNLPQICPINDQGVMLENTGFLANKKTVDVVDLVVDRLKQVNGSLTKISKN